MLHMWWGYLENDFSNFMVSFGFSFFIFLFFFLKGKKFINNQTQNEGL